MIDKKANRLRRAKRARKSASRLKKTRVSVHRTVKNIYVQAIDPFGKVLASASSLDKSLKLKYGGGIEAAKAVGKAFAERCKKAGLANLMFDRSGFRYHGRVKALAESIRENGVEEI